jgi:putative spermidine/putrescine transport system substrate-binding protein
MLKLTKIISLAAVFLAPSLVTAAEVNVVSWGGAYTESQKLGYGDPYQEKSGVQVNWLDYQGNLDSIKAQVESGTITYDIIDVFAKDTITGCDEGYFVEFDFDNDFPPAPDGTPASQDFFAPMPSKCAVGNILYAWNYAFSQEAFPADYAGRVENLEQALMKSNKPYVTNTPSTIEDFFDTVSFPGKRSIYGSAMSNLEMALVADGIAAGDVYTFMDDNGIDRALDKLSELCNDPNGGCIFWSSGTQPPEQLVSGEVVMATGWNGRHFNAIVNEKSPIEMVWDGQILDYEYFALVNGGPNQAEAMEALKYFTGTEGLAGSAKHIAYAPFRISSLDVITAAEPWFYSEAAGAVEIMPHMPTAPANTKNYVLMDPIFWSDNETEINDMWDAWKSNL